MNNSELLNLRLYNHLLLTHNLKEPVDIVKHMCAMQSQAWDIAKCVIGVRLPGSNNNSVIEAYCKSVKKSDKLNSLLYKIIL
jgi:hypothetical protein